MITSTSIYGLKMQWTPEHAQWAEQHFDISSTTRSPAHKAEAYRGHLQRTYQYAWANDDISALTASNLLKKYAEKYSGILDGPGGGERALLCSYAGGVGKSESEWPQEGVYPPMTCAPDVISAGKAGMTAPPSAADVSASMGGGSPGAVSSLADVGYSGANCGGLPSQEYAGGGYGGAYLHASAYNGQTAAAVPSPHPSPLHSSGLVQSTPAPPPSTLVPGYNAAGSPNLVSGYSYTPAGYPQQTAVAPGYSPGGAPPPPPSAYLPSGIATPTPLPPPSNLPGAYAYQSHSHAPIAPTPLNGSSSNSLKRKAFYMSGHGDMESYGGFGYGQQRSSAHSPMYRIADSSLPDSRGNGFDRSSEAAAASLAFKPAKQQQMPSDQQRKFGGQSGRAVSTPPPPSSYGPAKTPAGVPRSGGEPFGKFASVVMGDEEHGRQQHLTRSDSEEQLKSGGGGDAGLVEMVTAEVLQQAPPVDWSDIAGLDLAKAAVKEEFIWPILRPDMFSGLASLPRSLLLFGPPGTGRTLLGRCMASQLGAAFLRLSGTALATRWLGEGEKIVQASFLVARRRQPAVVFISEVDVLLSAAQPGDDGDSPVSRIRAELLAQLDGVLTAPEDRVLVVCSTSRPEDIPESLRRYFARRLLIPLPDAGARRQIVVQLLSQHSYCLSDEEASLLVRRTEGFSALDVARLCQEAVVGPLRGVATPDLSAVLHGHMRPVSYQDFDDVFCKFQPSVSQKELDTYTEWNKMFGCGQ